MTGIEPNAQQSQSDPTWSPQPDPDPAWSPLPDPDWPPPPPPRRPSPLWRPLGALLCFAAAILTLLGSFLTLLTTEVRESNNSRFALTITGWDVSATTNGRPDAEGAAAIFPTNGPPLVAAAVVLLAAAILAVFAAAAPSTATTRANSVVTAAAAAFLAGTTATLLMEILNWYDRLRPNTPPGSPIQIDIVTTIGLGFWLIVTATTAALAGFVLTWLPLRRRPKNRIEPDTPTLGIPAPVGGDSAVVHRLPDEPAEEPN